MHMMLMSMTGQKNRTSLPLGEEQQGPAAGGGQDRGGEGEHGLEGLGGQELPVPAQEGPEVVGVDGVVVVIVEGGGVLGEEPPEVEARGKGQGEEQQGPRPAEDAGGKPQPLPLADGEEQVQGGEDEHLGLAGHGEAVEQGGGLVLLPVQEEHREEEDGGAEGIGLAPLGGVDQHRRAEQVGRRQEQPRLLPQAALPGVQHRGGAAQVGQEGGQLHQEGEGLGGGVQPQGQPQPLQRPEDVQVAGGIVQEDVLPVDLGEAHLVDDAGPAFEGVHVDLVAGLGVAQDQPHRKAQQEQQAAPQGEAVLPQSRFGGPAGGQVQHPAPKHRRCRDPCAHKRASFPSGKIFFCKKAIDTCPVSE